MYDDKLFPTTVIGSYPKPKWLNAVNRLHEDDDFSDERLQEAEDDAVRVVIDEHEDAGIDVLSDGEMRREEMVEFFAEEIPGFEFNGPVRVWGNNYYDKPSVVEDLGEPGPMLVDEYEFARDVTSELHAVKVPITGPYTMTDWAFNEVYERDELVMKLADIMNDELKRLADAGAEYIQIDEPALSTRPEDIDLVREATAEVVDGLDVEKTFMHVCYGDFSTIYPDMLDFEIDQFALEFANNDFEFVETLKEHDFTKELGFGCLDVHDASVESVEEIKQNIEKGLEVVPPEDLWVNPDCGVKLLPRDVAYQKMKNMVDAADELREEYE
ncbi:MAG: methionine synthase [Halobacteria archaeon]|nr:methionine synthase [Halobacteria archaeon]